MNGPTDLIILARRVDTYADEADTRGGHQRAAELRQLARALRTKDTVGRRRLSWRTRRVS